MHQVWQALVLAMYYMLECIATASAKEAGSGVPPRPGAPSHVHPLGTTGPNRWRHR
jgi:hypothetical protein